MHLLGEPAKSTGWTDWSVQSFLLAVGLLGRKAPLVSEWGCALLWKVSPWYLGSQIDDNWCRAFLLNLWNAECVLCRDCGHSPLQFFLAVVHEVCIVTEATGGLLVCSSE